MKRIYKIHELTICISATIKSLPYNVWRDLIRCAWSSVDLSSFAFGEYEMYKFANKNQLDKAVDILNGANFKEVSAPNWREIIDACYLDKG